jgi:hypothetical protein
MRNLSAGKEFISRCIHFFGNLGGEDFHEYEGAIHPFSLGIEGEAYEYSM